MLMYLCVIGIKNRKPQLLDIKSIAVLLCDSAAITILFYIYLIINNL
jgi:hypothetical protein